MSAHRVSCDRCGMEFCYEALGGIIGFDKNSISEEKPCECCDGYGIINLDSGIFLCEECKGIQEPAIEEDAAMWAALCGGE